MTFWSGERLADRIQSENIIAPFSAAQLDCNAYKLRLGAQVYVSPTNETEEPHSVTIRNLYTHNDSFTIPPGQFAFVITEESVKVPGDAMAFISIRATVKFRGLVNVSGFHVDPGYNGQLIFSVFNAGPASVHLKRGDDCFLIWFADLERKSEKVKVGEGFKGIPTQLINPISGQVQSFEGLLAKIKGQDKRLTDRIVAMEREQAVIRWVALTALTIAIGLALRMVLP